LRDTALLLVALLLVTLFADGDLSLALMVGLVLAWAVLSSRGSPSDASIPLWFRLVPLVAAIVLADLIADEHWYPFTLVAVAAPLFVLARAGLVLQRRAAAP
jgi:hypothetical protein